MTLPNRLSYWNKFIGWFCQNDAYWYFPKGRSVNSEDVIEAFRILSSYEGEFWKDVQHLFLTDLTHAGLFNRRARKQSKQDSSAMARMWKVVFSTLGFAWVEDDEKVAITTAGAEFLSANNPQDLIEKQIQRYQISNPNLRTKSHKEIQIRPHIFLLDVLLNAERFITDDEYNLFVSRAQKHDDIDLVLEFIEHWRSLTDEDQLKILDEARVSSNKLTGRRTNLVNTINLNRSYALSFLTFCSYLERTEGSNIAVKLKASGKYEAEKIVRQFQSNTVFIEYRNAKDWFAYYGDPNRLPTRDEAIDYYVDTSQTDKLVGVEGSGFSVDAQISEKILEDFLEKNLTTLEKDLSLVGRQYPTITGPIDLLCKDKNNDFVVVELKKGRTSDKVVGQILRYIAFIEDSMIEHENQKVRGIIVGREIDKSLEMSLKAIRERDLQLKTFDANIIINSA